MASPAERKDLAKKWMLASFRQRLRSAKVNESLDRWLSRPGAKIEMRFEFVMDDLVLQAIEKPDRAADLAQERL